MAELVDALVSGTSVRVGFAGSNPVSGTKRIAHYILISVFLLLSVILNSCNEKTDYIFYSGKPKIEKRKISPFNSIIIYDNLNINFTSNLSDSAIIEGAENLLKNITFTFKDSILILKNENKFNWLRSYKKNKINIKLPLNNLKYVEYRGYGNIGFDAPLTIDFFEFQAWEAMGSVHFNLNTTRNIIKLHTGSLDVRIRGKSQQTDIYVNGNGTVNTLDLQSLHLTIQSKTTNNCYVSAEETLGVWIHNIGNVYYSKKPVILWNTQTNKGKLIKLDK